MRGREGEGREERWAGPGWGHGCQEKRQADWPSRAQTELLMPSDEIEMQEHQPRRGVGRDRWQQVPVRHDSNHAH